MPPPAPDEPAPVRSDAASGRVANHVYRPAPATNPVLDALHDKGFYRSAGLNGQHVTTCPWASEHQPGADREAIYCQPSDSVPLGSFFCPCTHAKPHRIGSLLEHLGIDHQDARCQPRIRVKNGETHNVVAAAETVLADRGGFYRSNGMISTIERDPHSGDMRVQMLSEQSIAIELSAAAYWEKYDGRSESWKRCDVPHDIVTKVARSQKPGDLPVLNALVRQPYLREDDGVLVTAPGFDAGSGVFAAFDPAEFLLPDPTRANAMTALARLRSLLTEFEFASPADEAAALSTMLTGSIRNTLPVAPGFNITASSPGSGKSYLASVLAPFAGPGDKRDVSYPMTSEEATKVVLSLALERPAVVCFDDMTTDWLPHGAMNRMMTSGSITERVLGSNKVVTARTSSLVMGTGNNIRPLRDMARRVVSIYLLPQTETVATREYAGRPADEVRANRGRYVSDALTIIEAFRTAGMPRANVPNVAGFEAWSDLCRHSLIWLGLPDPASSLIEQVSHDPDAELLGDLLDAWRDAFGTRPTMVRQVIKYVDDHKHDDLHAALMELPCTDRGFVNQSKFGRYLGRNRNRIVRGLRLVDAEHTERKAWQVLPIDPKRRIAPKPEPEVIAERAWSDLHPATIPDATAFFSDASA